MRNRININGVLYEEIVDPRMMHDFDDEDYASYQLKKHSHGHDAEITFNFLDDAAIYIDEVEDEDYDGNEVTYYQVTAQDGYDELIGTSDMNFKDTCAAAETFAEYVIDIWGHDPDGFAMDDYDCRKYFWKVGFDPNFDM